MLLTVLSLLAVLITGYLVYLFYPNPARGMAVVKHRAEDLPQVMTGRYIGFFLFAIGAAIYRDPYVIAWMFAVFATVSFWDVMTYRKGGHAYAPHLQAGLLSIAALAITLYLIGAA